jgi:hypothetical protein
MNCIDYLLDIGDIYKSLKIKQVFNPFDQGGNCPHIQTNKELNV